MRTTVSNDGTVNRIGGVDPRLFSSTVLQRSAGPSTISFSGSGKDTNPTSA